MQSASLWQWGKTIRWRKDGLFSKQVWNTTSTGCIHKCNPHICTKTSSKQNTDYAATALECIMEEDNPGHRNTKETITDEQNPLKSLISSLENYCQKDGKNKKQWLQYLAASVYPILYCSILWAIVLADKNRGISNCTRVQNDLWTEVKNNKWRTVRVWPVR